MATKIKTEYVSRPPIVVVMGHIDHGKSTLLDYIRKANTTEKEVGGITQHLSAYEAEVIVEGKQRKITFLDTPGHEAFCTVRKRGVQAADIAILVVSAEDGVKPQTIEALNCIKESDTPFIIAINKIDKPNANIDKTKQNLAENDVFVEGWGGTIPFAAISAKTGEGMENLLEMIILQADLEEFVGNLSVPAEGFIVESNLNPRQGISTTLIIKDGCLKVGSFIATEEAYAPIRSIENFSGQSISEAGPSKPIKIVGWNAQPKVGSIFKVFENKEAAIQYSSKNNDEIKMCDNENCDGKEFLDLIIKADTFGSLDAIEHEFKKINNEKIAIRVISKDVGEITEKDIKTANVKKDLVVGFNVHPDKRAEALAMRDGIEIKTFNIIYELIDYVKQKAIDATPKENVETVSGKIKVLKLFSKNKDKQVVGGKIEEGEIKSGENVKIFRRDTPVGNGKIKELQIQKIKTNSVSLGQEFGMMVESKIDLAPGDILQATTITEK